MFFFFFVRARVVLWFGFYVLSGGGRRYFYLRCELFVEFGGVGGAVFGFDGYG